MAHASQKDWKQDLSKFKLDLASGVPLYRQLIDQILIAIASEELASGDQLPTVHTIARYLAINTNTVVRAYKELEVRGVVVAQRGIGTFVKSRKITTDEIRQRRLAQIVNDFVARAFADGYQLEEVIDGLDKLRAGSERRSPVVGQYESSRVDRKAVL
jgi:GntR family transcriptional regulator